MKIQYNRKKSITKTTTNTRNNSISVLKFDPLFIWWSKDKQDTHKKWTTRKKVRGNFSDRKNSLAIVRYMEEVSCLHQESKQYIHCCCFLSSVSRTQFTCSYWKCTLQFLIYLTKILFIQNISMISIWTQHICGIIFKWMLKWQIIKHTIMSNHSVSNLMNSNIIGVKLIHYNCCQEWFQWEHLTETKSYKKNERKDCKWMVDFWIRTKKKFEWNKIQWKVDRNEKISVNNNRIDEDIT